VRIALALALAAASLGCGGPKIAVKRSGEGKLHATAIAVYPYGFRWQEPPFRSMEKAMDAVLFLSGERRPLVFGPTEFRCLRPDDDNVQAATDLVQVMAANGIDPRGFLAFRGWAEKRIASGSQVVEGSGGKAVGRRVIQEITYVAHLDVLDGGSNQVILELSGQVENDPFAEKLDYDGAPELTTLHRKLVKAAWEEVEGRLGLPRLKDSGVDTRWLPAAEFEWAPPGQRPLRDLFVGMDLLEADAAKLAIYRYWEPEADDGRLSRDAKMPGGLYVERARGAAESVLRRGDVILNVGTARADQGPQVLDRAVQLAKKGEKIVLRVARGLERHELSLSVGE
jgi:hypothetical protein